MEDSFLAPFRWNCGTNVNDVEMRLIISCQMKVKIRQMWRPNFSMNVAYRQPSNQTHTKQLVTILLCIKPRHCRAHNTQRFVVSFVCALSYLIGKYCTAVSLVFWIQMNLCGAFQPVRVSFYGIEHKIIEHHLKVNSFRNEFVNKHFQMIDPWMEQLNRVDFTLWELCNTLLPTAAHSKNIIGNNSNWTSTIHIEL